MRANVLGKLLFLPLTLAQPTNSSETRALEGIDHLAKQAYNVTKSHVQQSWNSSCSWENILIRKEWGDLSKEERRSYIRAVQCLQSKPAHTPSELAAGAKTRFDDYVVAHINQTLTIHVTGNFLSWHRYFTFLYEKALRNECGYKGAQPYWDWAKTSITGLSNSPIFDGSETSMSGDGEYVANEGFISIPDLDDLPYITFPTGNGGGCVKSGPFKNMTVNLAPVQMAVPGGGQTQVPDYLFAYQPRCLSRDLSDEVNRRFSNASAVLNNLATPQNIYDFQMLMQGPPGSGSFGIHGGAHHATGGNPARDIYVSPGDPIFYLNHAMIDRLWWIWQMQSPEDRLHAIAGTNTFSDRPPSANTTLDDYVDLGFANGPPRKIRELMSISEGPFCYIYQ